MTPKSVEASEMVKPFYSGSEWIGWTSRNCARCTKRWRQESGDWRGPCEMETAIAAAYVGDGLITKALADRANRPDGQDCPEREIADE